MLLTAVNAYLLQHYYFFGILFGQAVAQMAAIGFELPKDAFTSLMKQVNVVPCLNTSALGS